MKAYQLFLVLLLFSQPVFSTDWSLLIINTSSGKNDVVNVDDVLQVIVTNTGNAPFRKEPYYLVLNNTVLDDTKAFYIDTLDEKTRSLFFRLNEKGVAKVLEDVPGKGPLELTVNVADNTKNNFTQVSAPNIKIKNPQLSFSLLSKDTIRPGGRVELKAVNISSFDKIPEKRENIRLYFNGVLIEKAKALGVGTIDSTLVFDLDADEVIKYFYQEGNFTSIEVGLGDKESKKIMVSQDLKIEFIQRYKWGVSVMLFLILLVLLIGLSYSTNLIKDSFTVQSGNGNRRPYSLARTQFAIWTFVILCSYIYIWLIKSELATLPSNAFILLGISASVTTVSGFIDNQITAQGKKSRKLHSNTNTGQGWLFFIDLLSDSSGVSIHRLQNLLFTVLLSGYFLYEVKTSLNMPQFSAELLTLTGVSGAAYTFVKTGENE